MESIRIRSGAGEVDVEPYLTEAHRLLIPCLEAAFILAAEYSSACKRATMTSRDFEYALKFSARRVLGYQTETFFPEMQDDEDPDDVLDVDEDEEVWTRYDGPDSRFQMVNEAAETWGAWVPETELQDAMKRSIDSYIIA
jgi:hypothetical protein